MQIRLPTSSISGNSGQLSGPPKGMLPCKLGCPLPPYTDIVGSSVGNPVGSPLLSSTELVGSSVGSPLSWPLLNSKWKTSLIHMQDTCSTCVYNAWYSLWSQINFHKTNRINIMHFEYSTTWHSYTRTYLWHVSLLLLYFTMAFTVSEHIQTVSKPLSI